MSDDMDRDDGGDAFPTENDDYYYHGMRLRDYFACQAMAFLGHAEMRRCGDTMPYQGIAAKAYAMADAMLSERQEFYDR